MSRRARIVTAIALVVAAATCVVLASSLVQVTGGNLTTAVTSRTPDWSTNAAALVIGLGILALVALVAAIIAFPKRAKG